MNRWIRVTAFLTLLAVPMTARAAWIWDNDDDKIDDRFAQVNQLGILAAYTNQDPVGGHLRFQANSVAGVTTFGAYVRYDHHPTSVDVALAQAAGAQVLTSYRYFNTLRVLATYPQIQAVRSLPGVIRVETIQALYPVLDHSARGVRARETDDDVLFPAVWKHFGIDGSGVVIGILDTGINDAPDSINPGYPGHESLTGRFLGGGDFSLGSAALDRPDINPQDHGGEYHATHVAGIALGTGGPSHLREGVAPGARFVDLKVLSDAGVGFGVLEALDWAIAKRDTMWMGPGNPTWKGIQVLNLSLAGTDNSDGQDQDAAAINVAASYGILAVAAMGNDARTGYVPSPASADSAIAVGGVRDGNTIRRDDDAVDTDYSNAGPRADDGDSDHLDELKPLLAAPGSDIVSANGDPTSNGTLYKSLNGTSMAAPHVSGALALMLQAHPGLCAAEAQRILRFTSEHKGIPGDPFSGPGHPDSTWSPAWGYGELDAYAATCEALNTSTTQVVQISARAHGATRSVLLRWTTQREVGATGFHVYRSLDSLSGYVRLTATPIPSVGTPAPPADSTHRVAVNRTGYTFADTGLSAGVKYYYRISWVGPLAVEHPQPVIRATLPSGNPIASLRIAYTHDYADQDLDVSYGSGHSQALPDWSNLLGGTSDADSLIIRPGVSFTGTHQWIYHVDLYDSSAVSAYLPPSGAHPWFLAVTEGGFVNTSGSVDGFQVLVRNYLHTGRDSLFVSGSAPQHTAEGQTSTMWIPFPIPVGVGQPAAERIGIRSIAPNPSPGRCEIVFSLAQEGDVTLTLHDVTGRQLATLLHSRLAGGEHRSVLAASLPGHAAPLASGIYFLHLRAPDGEFNRRLVLIH